MAKTLYASPLAVRADAILRLRDWAVSKPVPSLLDFTTETFGKYRPAPFHEQIARRLEAVARGEVARLMVFLPPRHGKSELVSVRFPAWYLGQRPDSRIIHASYGATLSNAFSRQVRNLIASQEYGAIFHGVTLAADSRSVDAWNLTDPHRGGLVSVGVGGGVTGKGAHLLLIDDPVKSASEADSETYRERVWDWYRRDAYTRLEDHAAIVLVMTRWHGDDLAGKLLAAQELGGDRWEVLSLPAISEDNEALWPEKYDLAALENIRSTIGTRAWEALYQQQPGSAAGNIFKAKWLSYAPVLPTLTRATVVWDTAYSSKVAADYSVATLVGLDKDGRYYVQVLVRDRIDFPQLLREARELVVRWPQAEHIVEARASGKSLVQMLQAEGIPLIEVEPDGHKTTRAHAVTMYFDARLVSIVRNQHSEALEHELLAFPYGKNDDMVDTVVYGLLRIGRMGSGAGGIY